MGRNIVILDGDQPGQELLEEALRVLQPDIIRFELDFIHYDLSLENRRATNNQVVYDAGRAIREHQVSLKAATITPETQGDVGSPNAILREEMDAEIILKFLLPSPEMLLMLLFGLKDLEYLKTLL